MGQQIIAGVITSSCPRNVVILSIGTIGTIVSSSAAGIPDWNVGEQLSIGGVLGVNLAPNYALWTITHPTKQNKTCDHQLCAHHNRCDRLSPGQRTGVSRLKALCIQLRVQIQMKCFYLIFG